MQSGQLNVFSFRNQNTDDIQHVRLFECEELRAYLVVMPPGATIEHATHANKHELFDVSKAKGEFTVDGRTFRGDMRQVRLCARGHAAQHPQRQRRNSGPCA